MATVQIDGERYAEQVDGVWQIVAGAETIRATEDVSVWLDAQLPAQTPTGLDAALVELEKPITITGSTVAAVRTSATAELERIRAAVVTALTPA